MLLQDSPDEQELFQAMGRVVNSLLLQGDQSESEEPSSSSDTPHDNSECQLPTIEEQSPSETQSVKDRNSDIQHMSREGVETDVERVLGDSITHSESDQGEKVRLDGTELCTKSNADEDILVRRQEGPCESDSIQHKLEGKTGGNDTAESAVQQMERTVLQETVIPAPPTAEDIDSALSTRSVEPGVIGLQDADHTDHPISHAEDVDSCTIGGE